MKTVTAYKLARPDGWDFYTGKTINYRENIGKVVKCPNGNSKLGVCSSGVIHASKKPNDCFVGARIPCSAYRVKGKPVCGSEEKWGFLELEVLEEIKDLDTLFGWKYSEVINPVNPLKGRAKKPTIEDIELLQRSIKIWDEVKDSVASSLLWNYGSYITVSVEDSIWCGIGFNASSKIQEGISASDLWGGIGFIAFGGNYIWQSVHINAWAYIGSLFPGIKKWKYMEHKEGEYPFQPIVDLWHRGFVASFDGRIWRLHSGKNAKIVYEEV